MLKPARPTRRSSGCPWISQPSGRSWTMECKFEFNRTFIEYLHFLFLFSYKGKDEFKDDVGLIFQNCQIFNEDDSPVGKCGRNMKTFFHKRWTDLTSNWGSIGSRDSDSWQATSSLQLLCDDPSYHPPLTTSAFQFYLVVATFLY